MSGNLCHQGGGGQRLMAKTILNFHFDYLTPSLMTILRSFWKKFPNPSKCCRWIPCPNCILKAKAIFLFELYFSKLKVLSCCRHLCKYFSREFGHLLNWISDSCYQENWERSSILERRRKYLNCVFPSRARSICYTKLTRDIQPQNFSRSLDGPLAANSRLATRPSVKLKAKRFKVLNITIAK